MSSHLGERFGSQSRMGFNGQLHEAGIGWQLLGNGYRAYSQVLMRFNGPDSLSPLYQGGFNAYVYCRSEPVNRADPSGHFSAYILPAALGAGALALGIGTVVAEDAGVQGALGALTIAALGGAAVTFPFKEGSLVSRLFSRGNPAEGQKMRTQWKPTPRPQSVASVSSSGGARGNSVNPEPLRSTMGDAPLQLPVRYAGRGQRLIVEEDDLISLKSFDPWEHAAAPRLQRVPPPSRSTPTPVERQKQIRKNRDWFLDRRKYELRDGYKTPR